jgi:hypothetical protein
MHAEVQAGWGGARCAAGAGGRDRVGALSLLRPQLAHREGGGAQAKWRGVGCYVHHRRLPDLGDVGVCGLFY